MINICEECMFAVRCLIISHIVIIRFYLYLNECHYSLLSINKFQFDSYQLISFRQ